jgi:hypothetical protein
MLLKLLALLIVIWIFFKAIGQIFKVLLGRPDVNRSTRYTDTKQRKKEGINVEYDPKAKDKKGYEGGEYVEYEEVD